MKMRLNKICLPLALIAVFLFLMSDRVTAQTFTTLHPFVGGSDGAAPEAGLTLSGSTLYGTAADGGNKNFLTLGSGTIFAVQTDGLGFYKLFILFRSWSPAPTAMAPIRLAIWCCRAIPFMARQKKVAAAAGTVFRVSTDGLDFTEPLHVHEWAPIWIQSHGGLELVRQYLIWSGQRRHHEHSARSSPSIPDGTGFEHLLIFPMRRSH